MKKYERILLVDDDDICQYLHKRLLEELHSTYHIVCASNGLEALEYLALHITSDASIKLPSCPDLILLDINMPIMNGFQFIEHCKANRYLKEIRIVLLTSSPNSLDLSRAQEYGVSEYIIKPLTKEKLQTLIAV